MSNVDMARCHVAHYKMPCRHVVHEISWDPIQHNSVGKLASTVVFCTTNLV